MWMASRSPVVRRFGMSETDYKSCLTGPMSGYSRMRP